jgi:hypothetical protein
VAEAFTSPAGGRLEYRAVLAAGVFSLSVVLDEDGREIDTCNTGAIHYTARAS